VVKCRPPGNRTPLPKEVEACSPYLFRQLSAISPRVICTLGGVATQTLLGPEAKITRVRGRWHQWRGIPVMPTFHPSYLLRYPGRKREVWEDMKQVMAFIQGGLFSPGG
jgi:DNA polymerase